jgi:Cellulase (glycosyl hydrolase family 5)
MCDGNCAANQFLDEYDQPLPFLPERLFALEYQKHSLPQPDIFPVCVTFASVMFPAPAVILSCVAIVVSVALSVVGCASEAVVSTSENVIPVAKTNNTRTFDFVIHFIKEDLLYKKLPRTKTADRYGIRVIYNNHQYQTSSWLDPKNGTGFPASLFHDIDGPLYERGSGGKTHHESSKIWWTNWWNRSIKDPGGADGSVRMAEFLKKIVNAVNEHTSTIGYEILNEPQIHNDRQWNKVGEFNTYMVKELRNITQKIIVFSQQIPGSKSAETINITPKNIAKMAPDNKTNVIFKFTLYLSR